jgi:hypothetical protein
MARDHELWLEEGSESTHRGWTFACDGGARHECMAWLPEGILERKLSGFFANCGAAVVDSTTDSLRVRLGGLRRRGWRPRQFREAPLELNVQLHRDTVCVKSMTHVSLALRPLGRNLPADAVRQHCIELVKDLRGCLMAEHLERRFADRTVLDCPVELWSCRDNGGVSRVAAKLNGSARDLSASGIAVHVPSKPASSELCLKYRDRATEDVIWAKARVVRCGTNPRGQHICAARFDRTARFSKWDHRAELAAPDWDELFGAGTAADSDDCGATAPAENVALRFDDTHLTQAPAGVNGAECGPGVRSSAARAERRAELERSLSEMKRQFDDLEKRMREHHAASEVLLEQIAQQQSGAKQRNGRDSVSGESGPTIQSLRESFGCGKTPAESGQTRSVHGSAVRTVLCASTVGFRTAADDSLRHALNRAKRKRWWTLFSGTLILSTVAAAGFVRLLTTIL